MTPLYPDGNPNDVNNCNICPVVETATRDVSVLDKHDSTNMVMTSAQKFAASTSKLTLITLTTCIFGSDEEDSVKLASPQFSTSYHRADSNAEEVVVTNLVSSESEVEYIPPPILRVIPYLMLYSFASVPYTDDNDF